MYSKLPSFVLGFHGCDRDVGEAILAGNDTPHPSNNDYDWLGNGVYFWENSPERALSYAKMMANKKQRTKGNIKNPFVIGAIIDLGLCLNLTDETALNEVKSAYDALADIMNVAGGSLPVNAEGFKGDGDKIKRHLDCAVIMMLHTLREQAGLPEFESVRSPFFEGNALYAGTQFTQNAHVQISVRNLRCIKGYFRPLNRDGSPLKP